LAYRDGTLVIVTVNEDSNLILGAER